MTDTVVDRTGRLRIAVQRSGRLSEESIDLLERCGLAFSRSKDRLFWYGLNLPVDVLLVRHEDIPALIRNGSCDLGIAGDNVVAEQQARRPECAAVRVVRTLDFGHCRLSIGWPERRDYTSPACLSGARIATTYPGLTAQFLRGHDVRADIVQLAGSVEIAPSLGTADAIVDLVSTGSTLRANHLREVQVIRECQAQLLAGPPSEDAEKEALAQRLLVRVDGVQQVRESKYVMLHAPRSALDAIAELLPGAEAPTVLPLEGHADRVAVHAVCRENVFWEHLEDLKAAGATAVLVLPVEKMLA